MKLTFTKMQGLGNDFVVFDGVRQRVNLNADQCRFLADRRFGIGCDQILLVEPPRLAGTDFPLPHLQRRRLRGGTVRQRRPLLRPLRARPGADGQDRDPGGHRRRPHPPLHPGRRPGAGQHGRTPLRPRRHPFLATAEADGYDLEVDGQTLRIGAVSLGNPHAVLRVDDLDQAPVARLGPLIESHPRFPRRVNAGFMQILDPGHIRLRVFERGAGETLACGTGACAAVAVGRRLGLLDEVVRVTLPGGDLSIAWSGGDRTHLDDRARRQRL
jgi:diaminopimelate epimerase